MKRSSIGRLQGNDIQDVISTCLSESVLPDVSSRHLDNNTRGCLTFWTHYARHLIYKCINVPYDFRDNQILTLPIF